MILPTNDESIVIIGAGCFGVSTAYHLLRRGYTDVTVIDRSSILPAPDAASNDINRSKYEYSLPNHIVFQRVETNPYDLLV